MGGIDSHGFFRLIHSTCIFAYHELSLRSTLILVQTVQKGDITKGGGAAYSDPVDVLRKTYSEFSNDCLTDWKIKF